MNTHEDFRNVIRKERETLTRLSDYWNTQVKCDPSLSKDSQGRIRAAVGKTRLLLAEKFKQFEGLVEQSESNTAEKEISLNDLQGFWDLVLIQVNEIKEMFRSLNPNIEKIALEGRKNVKPRSPEIDRRDGSKSGSASKKKAANDSFDQAERKLKEAVDKGKRRSEAADLKGKVSFSKL